MSTGLKLKEEIKALALATLYFGIWIGTLFLLKKLILEDYAIEFQGVSAAVVGTLVLAKVVLILEHFSLGGWLCRQPVWVETVLRTVLYCAGVFVVVLLEKAFEGRHEYGGFGNSLSEVFQHADDRTSGPTRFVFPMRYLVAMF